MSDDSGDTFLGLLALAALIGYLMNFQNLFQYDMGQKEFIISLIGVFVPILGIFTGYIW